MSRCSVARNSWVALLDRLWSWNSDEERCAAFHALVQSIPAQIADVGMPTGKYYWISLIGVKLLKADHAVKGESRLRRHRGEDLSFLATVRSVQYRSTDE